MAITRRAMEHFRQRGRGRLMVHAIGGRMAFPYFGYYNATKHALEASYEALWYECRGSDIQIKIVSRIHPNQLRDSWDANVRRGALPCQRPLMACSVNARRHNGNATNRDRPVIINALFDTKHALRYHAGKHSGSLLLLRKLLPDSWFQALISRAVLRGQNRLRPRPRGQLFS